AGKDRTGVVGAFLLDLLGVGRDEIIDEYALTSTHLAGDFPQSITRHCADAGISGNLAETATAAPPALMHGLLADIDAQSAPASAGGSAVQADLLTHGMDPAPPERLRACLLEPADRYRGFGPVGPQGALSLSAGTCSPCETKC